jgi:hypothetical protein
MGYTIHPCHRYQSGKHDCATKSNEGALDMTLTETIMIITLCFVVGTFMIDLVKLIIKLSEKSDK